MLYYFCSVQVVLYSFFSQLDQTPNKTMEAAADEADKMTSQQALCEPDSRSRRPYCIPTLKVLTPPFTDNLSCLYFRS